MKYTKKRVTIEAVQWNGDFEVLKTFPNEEIKHIGSRDGETSVFIPGAKIVEDRDEKGEFKGRRVR